MLNKVFMSVVVMLLGLTGVIAASGAEATNLEAGEQVCAAAYTAQELAPPGPTAACPAHCGTARLYCWADCDDQACRTECAERYVICCDIGLQ